MFDPAGLTVWKLQLLWVLGLPAKMIKSRLAKPVQLYVKAARSIGNKPDSSQYSKIKIKMLDIDMPNFFIKPCIALKHSPQDFKQ